MANTIKIKRGSGSDPAASDMVLGEPVLRTDTAELFFKKDDGSVAKVSGGGGGPDFKYLALRNAANNGAASYPNADFTLVTSGTTNAKIPSAANTLLVSVNGVIQKPNTGTSTPSSGFALNGSTIKFAANISAAPDFILYQESGGIGEPSDETVTEAKLKTSNSPVNGYFLTAQSGNAGGLTWAAPNVTGNAATATALQTARTINGVSFDGTANITVTAAAGTLSGTTLNSSVTASSLTSLGDLGGLTVNGDVVVDTSTLKVDSSNNRVGIGTASPTDMLDVYNSTNNSRVLRISHPQYPTAAAAFFGWSSDGSGTTNNLFNIGVQYSSNYYNVLNIKRSTQQVGINNNNPSQSLDVTGNIAVSGTVDGVDIAALSSTVSGLSNTTINANAANRVITGSNTANTLNGEGELTFASSKLSITATTQGLGLNLKNTSNEYTEVKFDAARTGAGSALGILTGRWNNQHDVAQIYLQSGDDTTNKDDGRISFNTQSASGSSGTRMRIEPDGKVGIGTTSPSTKLHVNGTVTATAYAGDGSALTGISAGATGGGSDEIFYENSQAVTTDYTITSGKNAMSAGPITINNGVSVTVPSGSTYTIV